jgi:ketosteroid isomerase-like protein
MSETDVELMKTWLDESSRAEDPVGYLAEHAWAADIDYRAVEGSADDVGPIVGREAMCAYVGEWFELFDDLQFVAEETTDEGDGKLIARVRMSGTAKGSGVPAEIRFFVAYWIRNGRIARGREYMTRDEAEASVR